MLDDDPTKMEIYLKSVYFACMTMTTVGYGDIVPVNSIEYIVSIIMMVDYILFIIDSIECDICVFIEYDYSNLIKLKKPNLSV